MNKVVGGLGAPCCPMTIACKISCLRYQVVHLFNKKVCLKGISNLVGSKASIRNAIAICYSTNTYLA